MAERWRDIPGYDGYQASWSGHVRSVDRVLAHGRPAGGVVLAESPDKDGYLRVKVGGRKVPVHHLVMAAWIGPCPPGMERLHFPSGKDDNSVPNLRYGTHGENERDKAKSRRLFGSVPPRPSLPVTPGTCGAADG